MYYVFAVADSVNPASEVHEANNDAQIQTATEDLVRSGHDLENIRVVKSEDAKPVKVTVA